MLKSKVKKAKAYKIKTHSGAKKRFKLSATGKVIRSQAFMNHILTKKASKKKRRLRQTVVADKTNAKNIIKLIPYK